MVADEIQLAHRLRSTDSSSHTPFVRRLSVHAALLGIALLAILPVASNGFIALVDESVYAVQASNLANGSWAAPRPVPELDASGRYGALVDSAVVRKDWIPYSRQPLYPFALAPFYKIGGYSGLLVLSILGTWGAAVSAGLIARRMDRRIGIPTLWLTGIGTPLLFDAYTAIGHSLVAAMAGASTYFLLRSWGEVEEDGAGPSGLPATVLWTMAAASAGAVGVLLRSEGAVAAGALAAAGVLTGVGFQGRRPHLRLSRVGPSVVLGATAVGAFWANDHWASLIVTGGTGSGGVARDTRPMSLAWISLLRPWATDNAHASPAMALVAACAALGALAYRLLPRRPVVGTGLLALTAIAAVWRQFEGPDLISGLLATIPAVVVGLLLISRTEVRLPTVRLLLIACALTTLGILFLAYGQGGATEWGGRFFHVTLPLITPVAVLALLRWSREVSRVVRIAGITSLVVATASLSVLSVRGVRSEREYNRELVETVLAMTNDGPAGTPVVVSRLWAGGTARLFWNPAIDGFPVLNGSSIVSLARVLPDLEKAGVQDVWVLTDVGPDVLVAVVRKAAGRLGTSFEWDPVDTRPVGTSGLVLIRLQRQ